MNFSKADKLLKLAATRQQDNADRTSSCVVLINLLRPLDHSRWPAPASNEAFTVRNQKFSDLVVKCLIKLTKIVQNGEGATREQRNARKSNFELESYISS